MEVTSISHCKYTVSYMSVITWAVRGCLALAEVSISGAILHEFGRASKHKANYPLTRRRPQSR